MSENIQRSIEQPEQVDEQKVTGKPVHRVEDYDILTGDVDYIHDITPEGCLEMALFRSTEAHARIKEIDTSEAEDHPDCYLVLTAEDIAEDYRQMPGQLGFTEWALAKDKVRFVGEPLAVVVAPDRYIAEDIIDMISVDYEQLDAVTDVYQAKEDDVLVHEQRETNVADKEEFIFGDVEEIFQKADHIIEDEFSWGRISGVPLETAGAVADYDSDSDSFDIYCNMQLYTFNNDLVYEPLGYPEEKVRLHVPENLGGSFGTKIAAGARYCALAGMASHQLERPVKFVEDRIEYLQGGDAHSCEREYTVRLAVADDGDIQGIDISFKEDLGAFPRYPLPQALKPMSVLTTSYNIENSRYSYEFILTNKVPQTAYRGFGVQQHTFAVEMIIERAARKLDLDPTQFRWQNLVSPDQMPYKLPSKNIYDSGDYPEALNRINEMVDTHERCEGGLLDPKVVEEKREEGKYRGTMSAVTLEPSAGVIDYATRFRMEEEELATSARSDVKPFPEYIEAEIKDDRTVNISLATSSAGQGHQSIVTQMMADGLGISMAQISVDYLDSSEAPTEFGAAASRMGVMLSGAAEGLSEKIISHVKQVAATIFDCDIDELTYQNGHVEFTKGGESLSLAELVREDDEEYIQVSYDYPNPAMDIDDFDEALANKYPVYPATAYSADAPIVEVDVNTGKVDLLRYYSFHDCGTVINPKIVEGQVHGAIAHGIGAALLEEFGYKESGQPQAITFFDYLLPSIKNVPEMELEHMETPSPFTVRGVKGVGEGGVIAASAMIPAAINNALKPLDVMVDSVPVTSDQLRRKCQDNL